MNKTRKSLQQIPTALPKHLFESLQGNVAASILATWWPKKAKQTYSTSLLSEQYWEQEKEQLNNNAECPQAEATWMAKK